MKLFLDTANINQIKTADEWGILDGVTTNPTLAFKEGRKDFHSVVREICGIVNGTVSAEVTATDSDGIIKEARTLAKLHKKVVVKIPMIPEGVKAMKTVVGEGIKVNVTLVFSSNQGLIAAKAGAYYVSPFIGRLDDIGQDGMQLVTEIKQIYRNYGFKTQILAASIRHPLHVVQAATAGADIATMPFEVMEKMLRHPLTDAGLQKFLDDWKALQGK